MKRKTLKSTIELKIKCSRKNVFLRKDFSKLAGYDQVGRVLRELIKAGKLVRIGYGLYAKARKNRLTGQPMPSAEGGFASVSREALKRLKVEWREGKAMRDYSSGSSQVPARVQVEVFTRFNRKIGVGKHQLVVSNVHGSK